MADIEICEEASAERRTYLRSVFTYPVEFKLLSQRVEDNHMLQKLLAFTPSFSGYLRDISLGGAAIQVEDRNGRFNLQEAEHGKVLLTLNIPNAIKAKVYARVQWVKKEEDTSDIRMGISFKSLACNDLSVIEKLIGMKGKDYNMLWNLWERYCTREKTSSRYHSIGSWCRKFFSDN